MNADNNVFYIYVHQRSKFNIFRPTYDICHFGSAAILLFRSSVSSAENRLLFNAR
jgi:hypothetical protein